MNEALPLIAVVVPNWNGTELTVTCLRSIFGSDYQPQIAIVVDDHSERDPTEVLRRAAPGAIVLRRERNGGYGAACNTGAERALALGADYLLFLNNDATIDASTLPALVRAAGNHPGALLAPKIVYAERPDRIWSAGGWLKVPSMRNGHFGQDWPSTSCTADQAVDWVTGCAIFSSAVTYRRLGPWDEEYFLYHEDIDWCLRAKRRGIERWLVAEAVVRHGVTKTIRTLPSPQIHYYEIRNTYRLAYRYSAWWTWPAVSLRFCQLAIKLTLKRGLPVGWREADYAAGRSAVRDTVRRRWGPYRLGLRANADLRPELAASERIP